MSKPVNDFERIIDDLVNDMESTLNRLPEAESPLGARKLSKDEQLLRYLEVRDDPAKWLELITQRGLREPVEYALQMEQQYNRTVHNA
jgi:hypothetical protein